MPEVPQGAVVITPEAMYRETHERYGKIEAALTGLAQDVHPMVGQLAEHDAYINTLRQAGLPERFTQTEKDVLILKGRFAWALGAGATVCFLSGLVGAWGPVLLGH